MLTFFFILKCFDLHFNEKQFDKGNVNVFSEW